MVPVYNNQRPQLDCSQLSRANPYLLDTSLPGGWYDRTQQERQSRRAHIPCGRIGGPRAPELHSRHLDLSDNATATVNNIATHELLFRLGILGQLLTGVLWIFVTLALYRLFKEVDQGLAVLLVILGSLMQVPIFFYQLGE